MSIPRELIQSLNKETSFNETSKLQRYFRNCGQEFQLETIFEMLLELLTSREKTND